MTPSKPPDSLRLFRILLMAVTVIGTQQALGDATSARAAMENPDNPLVEISTTDGNIFLEMLVMEAPDNVANFLALAGGEVAITDPESGQVFSPNYYDGMLFHRAIPGLLIQTGSPLTNMFGAPSDTINDEINANALGLDLMPAVLADGTFNPILQISDREELEELVLAPLYQTMGIANPAELRQRQFEVDERLRSLTVKDVYQNFGYRYTERYSTRPIGRGTVALANSGPDSNGSEFFIAVSQAQWLNGRYTVIGRVVEGMEVVDRISQQQVEQSTGNSGTQIYNVRQI